MKTSTGSARPIRADEIYSLDAFYRATGFTRAALRKFKRQGLDVRYVGGRGFVYGQAFIEFVLTKGKSAIDSRAEDA